MKVKNIVYDVIDGIINKNSYSKLMTSQFVALYLSKNRNEYRRQYDLRLSKLGFDKQETERLFEFECSIIKKFGKKYLLKPNFVCGWFFNLKHPFFINYPKRKEDIIKEHFLTVSEICKIVDEAEWHFWNSHEDSISDEVFGEIYEWRLRGNGMIFAGKYFEMIEKETGVSSEHLDKLIGEQGEMLCRYKWA